MNMTLFNIITYLSDFYLFKFMGYNSNLLRNLFHIDLENTQGLDLNFWIYFVGKIKRQ